MPAPPPSIDSSAFVRKFVDPVVLSRPPLKVGHLIYDSRKMRPNFDTVRSLKLRKYHALTALAAEARLAEHLRRIVHSPYCRLGI